MFPRIMYGDQSTVIAPITAGIVKIAVRSGLEVQTPIQDVGTRLGIEGYFVGIFPRRCPGVHRDEPYLCER
jgi:hypothetical protein